VSSCAYISYLVLFHHPLCMHDICAHNCKVNFTPNFVALVGHYILVMFTKFAKSIY
jgi:hypothetical protein